MLRLEALIIGANLSMRPYQGLRGADIRVCGVETRLDALRTLHHWRLAVDPQSLRAPGIETSLDAAA
jgi:hypothetical protein